MERFPDELIASLAAERELDVETVGRRTGLARRATVWVVVADGVPYLRSEYADAGQWYRNALAQPRITLHVAGRTVPATAHRVSDPAIQRQVTDAFREKYRASGSLAVMVRPEVEPTTLALAPAG